LRTLVPWLTAGILLGGCAAPGGQEKDFGRRPDWSLRGPGGTNVSASDFERKVVVLDFWATWCPSCRREVPGWIELQDKYRGQGLVVLGLSFDRDPDLHDRWVKANHLNYLSLYAQTQEGKGEVAKFEKLIGPIEGYPTTLVINREGTIVYKHVGYGSPEEFERVLRPLF
jgi:thiol-disulfide isomerase/thioredoxin